MSVAEHKPDGQRELRSVLWRFAWLSLVGALVGALLDRNLNPFTQYFMAVQDAPVLLFMGMFFVTAAWFARKQSVYFLEIGLGRLNAVRFAWVIAIVVGCAILIMRHLAYLDFALSADEFMAESDARIFASGRFLAWVAPEWRDYVPALQPMFRLSVPENVFWVSSYLPVNAALRAIFVVVGAPGLQGAVLAGVSAVALCGVARRIWPDRPDAAAVARHAGEPLGCCCCSVCGMRAPSGRLSSAVCRSLRAVPVLGQALENGGILQSRLCGQRVLLDLLLEHLAAHS